MSVVAVTVRCRWEGGHRLPQLTGKCQSLHGHSWQTWVTVTADPDPDTGIVADMGEVKGRVQRWIDAHLDHAMMLADTDPLADTIDADPHCRVFRFGQHSHALDLTWPTVENVAAMLSRVASDLLADLPLTVVMVRVQETENNRADVIQ